jgi:hypothetical protein
MRKVKGVFVVALLALCTTAWSAEIGQRDLDPASNPCSSPTTADVSPAPEVFSIDAQPAAYCTNTCNLIQGQPCSVSGQHIFCTRSNCTGWGCTCMDGIIECGLP